MRKIPQWKSTNPPRSSQLGDGLEYAVLQEVKKKKEAKMHENWLMYADLCKNDHGEWMLYRSDEKGNVIAEKPTKENLHQFAHDLLKVLDKVRECCVDKGWKYLR